MVIFAGKNRGKDKKQKQMISAKNEQQPHCVNKKSAVEGETLCCVIL
jgi:hypothetical protein